MERLMRSLTNLDYSNENLDILKTYIESKTFPDSFSEYKKNRYKSLYKNFILDNGNFVYRPLNLTVIRDNDREKTIKDMYDDPQFGFGLGIKTFYDKIASKYLNIKRKHVQEFLTHQSTYQLSYPEKKPVNKPIIGNYPNQRWAIDLIDMSIYEGYNKHKKWILTGIDYFSKKVFARATPNKQAITIRDAFNDVCNELNTKPRILQTDNGTEFKKEFQQYCSQKNIHQIRTISYTPTGNALIENFNNQLRKMIREGFIKYNTLNWIDYLDDFVDNKNNTKHSVTKHQPNEIWREGIDKDINDDDDLIDAHNKLTTKAKRDVSNNEIKEFELDDYVRPSMGSLYSEVRKTLKKNLGKLIPVKYSPDIYQIGKVFPPTGNQKDFKKYSYYLKYVDSNPPRYVMTESKLTDKFDRERRERRFFASDLIKVDKDDKSNITLSDALKLNSKGVKFTKEVIKNEKDGNNIITQKRNDDEIDESKIEPRRSARLKKVKEVEEVVPLRRSARLNK